ncbi:MAG: hypothetical protein ACI4EH_03895 [Oliverpabstia sp.]
MKNIYDIIHILYSILQMVASLLKSCFHSHDFVIFLGGDKFVVIMVEMVN